MAGMQIDIQAVYEQMGIDTDDLGCVMLDVEKLMVSGVIPQDALFYRPDDPDSYAQGNVSETTPHITLLFGLMQSGQYWKPYIEQVLYGWEAGDLSIDKVGFFYSSDPAYPNYVTLVAFVKPTDALKEANSRLRMLPHIDGFAEYTPHITLAYVKDSSNWKEYVNQLNDRFADKPIAAIGINYGD